MTFIVTLVLFFICLISLHIWLRASLNILIERKIAHKKPKILLGNIWIKILFGKAPLSQLLIESQLKYRKSKIYGIYFSHHPIIFIQDAQLIERVFIKDFDNFHVHQSQTIKTEPDLAHSLLFLEESAWKETRDILEPTFESNSLRAIFELMNECCIEGLKNLQQNLNAGDNQELIMEDIFFRFTNDIILSAVLGIKMDSFRQKENGFFKIGTGVLNFSNSFMLKVSLIEIFPRLLRALGVTYFNAKKCKYFKDLVLSIIKYRKQNNIVRLDMIHFLMQAQRQKNLALKDQCTQLSDRDIVANCFMFFCAGFGKVGNSLRYTAHELIKNPEIQDKLYKEIHEVHESLNGRNLSYDILIKMQYMDMVVSESLRKWPMHLFLDRMRICNKDYELLDSDGNIVVKLQKNDSISISIIGLHRDPENYKNPEKFDPERFSEENRKNIKPFTYLPFGVGPRTCIGNRFALIDIKLILYHILLKYKLTFSKQTTAESEDFIPGFPFTYECYWFKLIPRN